MTTNRFPGIGYKTRGVNFNFFERLNVTATTFGGNSVSGAQPDMVITFPTQSLIFTNYGTGTTSVVEYSFNGTTVDGEMVPSTPSASMTFDNRVVCFIWFRLAAGSSGSVPISVQAWATR